MDNVLLSHIGLSKRATIGLLLLSIYLPLASYVMLAAHLGAAQTFLLVPAVVAVIILYSIAYSAWRDSRIARVGAILVFFWLLMATVAPYLPLLDPNKPYAPYLLPGAVKNGVTFLFGTDMRGRDMLSRTIWGSQRVIVWGMTATAAAYAVGSVLGLVAGYLGGWRDELISFICNVLLSFPVMVLFILILNYLGQTGFNIIVAVTVSSAPAIMRVVRGLALDARNRDYIVAARTRGENAAWIMFVEILPNVRGPLVVDACLRLGYTTVAITTLTFLGLGLQPPDPDWGLMIKEASSAALVWKLGYMLIIPAVAVSSLILGFNLIADGIREISLKD